MFHKQHNEFGCGPVAIMNAVVWSTGKRFGYRNYTEISKLCKTDKDGTYDRDMEKVLIKYGKKHGFKVTKVEDIQPYASLGYIYNERRKAVVISHPDLEYPEDWHWTFVYNSGVGYINTVNLYAKETITTDQKWHWFEFHKTLEMCFKKRKEVVCPVMFVLDLY